MPALIGRNFARIRQEKGLTQKQIALQSGFSVQYLSGLEQGYKNPTIETVYALAQALGVSHVNLLMPLDFDGNVSMPQTD
ncbi:hypothetical protein BR141012304_10297 [Brucella inopinata]|nr:hypothetical protein BR141012304_10297 [Brucella inopinata]